ncbi:NAD(+) diphosphatase [Lysobacter capsici]|uniref:NAD(+) diphosphatase n=1 Tax=Lysobacter capsici TaxID=435897 RepID=UPI0020793EB1|nr:NAD(+) diphosphatase [Lysobacter capsici]
MSTAPAFAFVEADSAWRAALDRADHLRDQPQALAALWPQARVIVLDASGQAYADDDDNLLAPLGHELTDGPGGTGASIFLGLAADGQGWFAIEAELVAFQAPRRVDLRRAAAQWPLLDASVFAQARALQHWRSRHRYCGVCGGEIAFARAGWTGRCSQCGTEHYPRTDPAVIVAVSDGERLLLGRQAGWPAQRYSVIAGFVEPGESLEQTVAREVLEETGVRVRSCQYLGSQPWPFPSALMLGFAAFAEPDAPQVSDELEEARWFTLDEIRAAAARGERKAAAPSVSAEAAPPADDDGPLLSPSISISRWLIEHWRVAAEERAGR